MFALKSEVDMLKMLVHKRTRAENNPTNHYKNKILITCNDYPNFQNAILVCHVNNKALIYLNCRKQHSLQSSNLITKTCKKWVMTLSSSVAMYSVMRDIPDARKVPMERGWVVLYLYATCKFSNILTLEQWAFEYGLPFFWYALYMGKRVTIRPTGKRFFLFLHELAET